MHAHTPTDLEDEQNMEKCNMLQMGILAGACSGHCFRSKNVLIGTSQSAWTKNFILQGLGAFEEFFFSSYVFSNLFSSLFSLKTLYLPDFKQRVVNTPSEVVKRRQASHFA